MNRNALRHIATLISVFIFAQLYTQGFAQIIHFKSNCERHFKITFIGTNKNGKEVKKTLDNVSIGDWETVSLYKVKYGYDLYNNKEMQNSGADASGKWQKMEITDLQVNTTDILDISQSADALQAPGNHIWVRIKNRYERDYIVSRIFIYDRKK